MIGADITVVTREGSKWIAEDRFAKAAGIPTLDTRQDVTLLGAEAAKGMTSFQISKPLVNCEDTSQDISIGDGLIPLILAYGNEGSSTLAYHSFNRRGTVWVNLMQKQTPRTTLVDTSTLNIRHANLSVPQDDETKYCYSAHVLPQDRKYHLVRAEPVLNSSHPQLVHHMIIYSCFSDVTNESYARASMPANCSSSMKVDCPIFWVLWAVGGGSLDLPDAAGLPMGRRSDGDVNTASHVVLEIHYTNPGRAAAIVDNSGFRLSYTANLRANDAGVLALGDIGFTIPPSLDSYQACVALPHAPPPGLGRSLRTRLGLSICEHPAGQVSCPAALQTSRACCCCGCCASWCCS